MKSIIWINCFLSADNAVYDAFSNLGNILAQQGVQLVVFSPSGDYDRCAGFRHYECTLLISDTGRRYQNFNGSRGLPLGASGLAEFLTLDHHWGAPAPSAEQELLVLRAIAFWERAFEIQQPSAVLAWGTSAPTARLLTRIAQRAQRPCYIMERGPVPGTLMLSLSGQVALSGSNTFPALIDPSLDEPALSKRWSLLKRYLTNRTKSGYQQSNKPIPEADLKDLRADPTPRILYLGNFDLGSGCIFSSFELGDCHSNWLNSSECGARLVHTTLEAMGRPSSLWIKPHPLTQFSIEGHGPHCRVKNIFDWDVNELVQAADICIALTSTTLIYSILYNKPLVTLANSFMMGRDIAYEVTAPELLGPMIEAALARSDLNLRLEKGRALLAALCERDLFCIDDAAPTRLTLADLATLLGRFRSYLKLPTAEANERLTTYEHFEAVAAGSARLAQDLIDEARRDREVLTAAIAEMEARHANAIQQISDESQRSLEDLKARHATELREVSEASQRTLDDLKARHASEAHEAAEVVRVEIDEARRDREVLTAAIAEMEARHANAIQQISDESQRSLEDLKARHAAELREASEASQRALDDLKARHASEAHEAAEVVRVEIDEARRDREVLTAAIAEMETCHANAIQQISEESHRGLEALKARYASEAHEAAEVARVEIDEARRDREVLTAAIAELELRHANAVQQISDESHRGLEDLKARHATELRVASEASQHAIDDLKTRLTQELDALAQSNTWLKNALLEIVLNLGSEHLFLLSVSVKNSLRTILNELLKKRGIFDTKAYNDAHHDVAKHKMDPLVHYIRYGLDEKRERR